MFDTAQKIDLKLQAPEGVKRVTVRFPTDEEWIERQRARKIVVKQLGRGMSETIPPSSEDFDLELVTKLREGESEDPAIDKYEASRILEDLNKCDVNDVTQDGGAFRISLRVPGATTLHVIGMPSAKDVIQYRRVFARSLDMPYNQQSITINLNAAADLYKRLSQAVVGYAGAVPIIHQAAVIGAAVNALEYSLGVGETENF